MAGGCFYQSPVGVMLRAPDDSEVSMKITGHAETSNVRIHHYWQTLYSPMVMLLFIKRLFAKLKMLCYSLFEEMIPHEFVWCFSSGGHDMEHFFYFFLFYDIIDMPKVEVAWRSFMLLPALCPLLLVVLF